ncbi:MAG: DUF1194 domain-containing protein [Pseudomonadota bacterium]
MVRLWAGVLVALVLPAPALACRLALVLALDASASVDEAEYVVQRNGLAAALIAPEVQVAFLSDPEPVALAAFEWSGQWNQHIVLEWRMIRSRADLLLAAEELSRSERKSTQSPTALGAALGFAAGLLRDGPRCEQRTIDVSGDGRNNHGFSSELAYKHFPLNGVTVNGLAIGGASVLDDLVAYFEARVIRGPGAFVERALDYDDFERAMRRKLEREVGRAVAARE